MNHLIAAGQYWRLITPAFLHANLMHLAVNCYSLNNLGPSVEMQSGGARFAAVRLCHCSSLYFHNVVKVIPVIRPVE